MKFILASSAIVATVLATTHQVTVGPGLSYSPSTVSAAQGDIVSFKFGSGHDVVSGSFDSPCQPDGKIYSGEPREGDVFSVTINGTDPVWIYCSVPGHCQAGMAMVINAPSDHTLDDYKSAAGSASSSSQPNNVVGGTFGNAGASSSSSSSASSSASSSSSSASSAASSSASKASTTASASSSASSAASSSAAASSSSSSSSSSSGADSIGMSVGLLSLSTVLGMLALW